MILPNVHCKWHYIWYQEKIWEVFPWRDIYYLFIPSMLWFSLFQCWWWWECEILLVKDFTTSPQISLFWELKLDLDQGWGWDFGSLRNGCRYMLYFMTFEPMNWARLEICYWRFSLFWNKSNTCYDDHISDQSFYCWWLKSWEDCIIKRAKQSYWWRIGDIYSPI